MDSQHNLLIIILLFVSFMTWQAQEQDKNPQPQQQTMQAMTAAAGSAADQDIPTNGQGKPITIKIDVLELIANTNGGDIEQVLPLVYPEMLKSTKPFRLLETTSQFVYQAQSGLTDRDGPDNPANDPRPLYSVDKEVSMLADGQSEIVIPLIYTDKVDNVFTKIFTLKCGGRAVSVGCSVQNINEKPLEVSTFGQLRQTTTLSTSRDMQADGLSTIYIFRSATLPISDAKYEKYKFDTILDNENLNVNTKSDWVVMLQQYFTTVWVSQNNGTNNFYTANPSNGIVAIGYESQPMLMQPDQTDKLQSVLQVGPAIQNKMAAVTPHLDLVVDYGWLWFISQLLPKLLKFIHSFFGNWGSSIIIITFIVRGTMYSLTKAQYTSMTKMRMLQPKIQTTRERLGNDK